MQMNEVGYVLKESKTHYKNDFFFMYIYTHTHHILILRNQKTFLGFFGVLLQNTHTYNIAGYYYYYYDT